MHSLAYRLLIPLLGILPAGCTHSLPSYHLDYTQYPSLPNAATSTTLRTISFVIPGLRKVAIYGRYGGPGSKPGAPIDDMDELFRRHDIAYTEGTTLEELRESDYQLISCLRALDREDMSWSGRIYRYRAICFFTSPISERFGKPREVIRGTKVRPEIIPGNRLEAEAMWQWHGPDPTLLGPMLAEAAKNDAPPATGRNPFAFPRAARHAGRR